MPNKIIIVTIMDPGHGTGVQTHFWTFLEYLKSIKYPAKLITPFNCSPWKVYPLFGLRKIIDIFSSTGSVWWYRYWHAKCLMWVLQSFLAEGRECIIYAQCPLSAHAALAARVSPKQRVFMITHFNVSQAEEWAEKGLINLKGRFCESISNFEKQVIPKVDGIVFVSEFMRMKLQSRIQEIMNVPYAVIPNFINNITRCSKTEVIADFISIGTIEPRKNHKYLLEILACARDMGHLYTLTLVGDGSGRAELEDTVHRLGLDGAVRFTGNITHAISLMSKHRAYIHTAKMESFGITLIEAMSQDLPVFAPAVGGIPEVFTDKVEGAYIPLEDASSAAKIIISLMENSNLMREVSGKAKQRYTKCFETSIVAHNLLEFLQQKH